MFWDSWKNNLNSAYEAELRIENVENKQEQKFI